MIIALFLIVLKRLNRLLNDFHLLKKILESFILFPLNNLKNN
jgi:hypothetical protein